MLIGLCGKIGAGKTTAADYLVSQYGFTKMAFADPLKQMLLEAGMCTYDELWKEKTEKSRWLLQKIGTDIFRDQVDPDFWIKKMEQNLQQKNGVDIVIDDVRFIGETNLIKKYSGLIIKVIRIYYDNENHVTGANNHKSENEIDSSNIKYDYYIVAASKDLSCLKASVDVTMKIEAVRSDPPGLGSQANRF